MEPNQSPTENEVDTVFDIDSIDLQILQTLANEPMNKSLLTDHIPRSLQTIGRRVDNLEDRGILDSKVVGLEPGERIRQEYFLTNEGYDVLQWKIEQLEEECESLQEQIDSLQDERAELAAVIS